MMVNHNNDPGCRRIRELRLAGFLERSEVNGPGIRAVLWVQGCPHRCRGCFNKTFQPFSPAISVDIRELVTRILALDDIDGVTFSGGEPFAQAGALACLGENLRNAGLTIVTYSGYTVGELAVGSDPAWPALLTVTDLLIAGPYVASLPVPDMLRGSANQQVIPIGTRLAYPPAFSKNKEIRAEFTITPEGVIITTGFPPEDLLISQVSGQSGG